MPIRALNFCLLILFVCETFSQTNDSFNLSKIPLKSHFDSKDYSGSIQNWRFDQDSDGILYVANNEGLLKFDGSQWHKFKVPLSTKIRAVKIDNQHRIFVGGQNQIGYFKNTQNGLKFTSLVDNLRPDLKSFSEIWNIIEINKNIYFNTESKLLVYNGDEIKELESPGFLQASFKHRNKIIAQFYEEGLFEFVNGKFEPIIGTKLLPEIVAVLENGVDDLYFSKTGILYKSGNFKKPFKDYSKEFGSINSGIRLNNGDYAIGTQNNGLFILNSNFSVKHHFTKNNGLSDRTVKSVYEDTFNNLWIALNNGIDYLKMSLPFSLLNEEVGVEGTGYAAHNFNESVYLGTSNGVFLQNFAQEPRKTRKYEFIRGSEGQVYDFSQIDNELILNHHQGAFVIKDKGLDKFHDIGSWKFIKTTDPNLILGGDYQGIRYFKRLDGKWNRVGEIPNLTESSRILKFENDSTLWMTHGYKGAYKVQLDNNLELKNKVQHFGKHSGFPSNILISSYMLNGKLIFTSEHGIFDFNTDSLKFSSNLFFDKMLGKTHVSQLVSSADNSIYYIQDQELGVLKQKSYGEFQKETQVFKHINKLINDDLQNISILDDQNILVGAKEGFIHYNPLKDHQITKDFDRDGVMIAVESSLCVISIDLTSTEKSLELHSEQNLKISYVSPYFDGFEDLQYSYKLTPLDEDWSKWSPLNEKGYEHLPYGQYTFEVKALNIYGIESKTSSFSFKVLAPWYATKAARLAYFGIGVLGFVLIPLIQQRRHKIETSFITKEKEKELKIKNKEIDKLQTEKLQTELDLKNEQLTSITMQFLKNKEFIKNIQDKIAGTLNLGSSSQELKRLIKTIDQELSDNDSWDQFAYHFDQVHGNYLEKLSRSNIRLSPREIKLAAFLRMNMSSKEISKLLNITTRGVELARYRLRKKLNLKREQNLVEFLIDLDNG